MSNKPPMPIPHRRATISFQERARAMLHKNLKSLRRSISEKLLGAKAVKQTQSTNSVEKPDEVPGSSQSLAEDPFREYLASYSDNVTHLVYHGSSLRSLSSYDLNKDEHRQSTHSHSSQSSTDSSDTTTSTITDSSSKDEIPKDERITTRRRDCGEKMPLRHGLSVTFAA
ncbi:unnamed protein product, partial [Mesorhabditis belari]|uniref:Uncharacterized protein n=1 Tax=Mesorhabditis belari TaxID=2138241 RepID=A0AAF3FGC9_9BILA